MTGQPTTTPDVSVVVIVYNDGRRLPTAVRSALRQTLRSVEVIICDDASTDDTPEVAERLCAEDPRVRYHRLPENSGGCGRPRNTGLEAARGTYVMFLDSDDRLERHACKNLLEALEDNDADVAMGLVRRQYVEDGRQTAWYPELFQERRVVVGGLAENPELIDEVLSVNKLYRRDFLERHAIRFPEDVHYEDQLFTFAVYHRARAIAVIPETVYLWRIFPPKKTRSITQQRNEIENFHHRLRVHRRLDDYIAAEGSPELQRVKDLKFLQNDMRLYLADVIDGDGTVTAEVLREAEEYLRAIPADRYDALPLALRAAYGMALRHDPEGLRELMLLDRRNILAPRVSVHDGTTYLSSASGSPGPDPAYPLDAPENRFLVADGSPILGAPAGTYHLSHEVVGAAATRDGLVLEGRTFDALGKIDAAGDDWSLTLALWLRGEDTRVALPVHVTSRARDEITWSATVRGSDVVRLASSVSWNFRVETTIREHYSTTPLIWHPGTAPVSLPMSLVSSLAYGQRAHVGPSPGGQTRLQIESAPGARRKTVNRLRKRVLPTLEKRVSEPWSRLWDDSVKNRAYAALRRLPLDRGLVVFEANMGTVYGDSPKYVYEEMRRTHPDMRAVWVLPERHAAPAADVEVVQRDTLPYLKALARAAYWVDNQTFPGYVRKRPGQRYLQTWHGIPLKKMGRDKVGTELPEQQPDRGVGAWDELVVPCPYFERVFVPAFDYRKGLVRYGTPRNDALVDGSLTSEQARRALDLPLDARVLLYAPTFREDNRGSKVRVTPPFDPAELLGELGDDNTYLLLRPHYLNRIAVSKHARYRTLDVSRIDDVNLLYHAADVLITDYSSVMFDFALLRKPMVFYTYDYAEYVSTRGTYVDLKEVAPGPFVTTTAELVEALRRTDADQALYDPAYSAFLEEYCGHEDGKASRRAVERLLNHGEEPT